MSRRWANLNASERAVTAELHPAFRAQLARLFDDLAEAGFDVAIPTTGGVRSSTDQAKLYNDSLAAGGGNRLDRVVAYPGGSLHEYGLAADFVITGFKGVPFPGGPYGRAADPYYTKLGAFVKRFPDLKWGGDFGDRPHVEWRHIRRAPITDAQGRQVYGVRTNGSRYAATRIASARVNGVWTPVNAVGASYRPGASPIATADVPRPVSPASPTFIPISGGALGPMSGPDTSRVPVAPVPLDRDGGVLPGPRLQPRRTAPLTAWERLKQWLGW